MGQMMCRRLGGFLRFYSLWQVSCIFPPLRRACHTALLRLHFQTVANQGEFDFRFIDFWHESTVNVFHSRLSSWSVADYTTHLDQVPPMESMPNSWLSPQSLTMARILGLAGGKYPICHMVLCHDGNFEVDRWSVVHCASGSFYWVS